MLLALDTSAGTSVAVVSGDLVLAERSTEDTMRHAEVIGELIADTLADAAIDASALTAVVAGMGPGPFTGLRVGIAAARGFAWARSLPLVPAVSHDAVAFEEWESGARGSVLVVTDARRREVYWSSYDIADAGPVRTDGPALCKPDELPYPEFTRIDATQVSAGALGRSARRWFERGDEPEFTEPLYLRSPDVTMPGPRKRVS
ncbi:tRNA (adenosine(37)-N6)-threonylcarbamoyltransferase complex dimerization subunit type 1 TsaB [Herbiconiux sp. KACC 21604]|uniref:tRNA (adenosine(37)-N6)-threonylcarbamoyltransferase complex dimerization subunit type 1 TsaB n=1 Tax=unclassified Herbiconiux TaxID=2618217 RepID=UPI001490E13C|nr:tRNA (adenosine(37)-N6)-threonylcarbamoyltransferase complex dimerization subunit type 1 TsaB [Herbiconiux sp. SALV-R1]QJU52438.1 tRNA (adenosine(37)-N6)-threonylcarbamoyltransferase complex dimerization subunit type 1 TsaB [Herbiconiux sp. SALV-R1]WPO87302.1 tRNA (adenosine(37)-N6)-threonylcarbamoyltransferase complex dimerization subunit type 1 TsaB [Herbiconiux sp. KACC 21604]